MRLIQINTDPNYLLATIRRKLVTDDVTVKMRVSLPAEIKKQYGGLCDLKESEDISSWMQNLIGPCK